MGLVATNKGGTYTPPPADMYSAACIGIYDLGTQVTGFGAKRQVCIEWELNHQKTDGSNYTITSNYAPSLNEKASFRKMLESWQGRKLTESELSAGFNLSALLGKSCFLQVMHKESNGKTFANVGAVTKLPNGMQPMSPTKPLVIYDMDKDGKSIPATVPEWIKNKILNSEEIKTGAVEQQLKQFEQPTLQEQAASTF